MKFLNYLLMVVSLVSCGGLFKDEEKKVDEVEAIGPGVRENFNHEIRINAAISKDYAQMSENICKALSEKVYNLRLLDDGAVKAVYIKNKKDCNDKEVSEGNVTTKFSSVRNSDIQLQTVGINDIYFQDVLTDMHPSLKTICSNLITTGYSSVDTLDDGVEKQQITFYQAGSKYLIEIAHYRVRNDKYIPYKKDRSQISIIKNKTEGFVLVRGVTYPCSSGSNGYMQQTLSSLN